MDLGDGANHRVFMERVGSAMHQPGPAAACGAIHREDVEGVAQPIQPLLNLGRFGGVLVAAELDAGLDFAAAIAV